MAPLNVLVIGAGIAGSSAAYWLTRAGHHVTMIERSPSSRKTGQGIDVRGPAVTVMQKMGVEEAVRSAGTHEVGIQKIGSTGNVIATFDATGDKEKQSFTSEYEILRSDLARVLTDAWKGEVIYGETVQSITQREDKVDVKFSSGKPDANFDLVVAADGARSRTREMVTGRPAGNDMRSLGIFCSYFTIPTTDKDSETHARLYSTTKGRSVLLRPAHPGILSAYLNTVNPTDKRFAEVVTEGPDAQRALINEIFADVGWEAPRVLDDMNKADDFYFAESAQVRVDKWSYGRVVLLGDAGYATIGAGTSAAIYGGYVLAGELTRSKNDVPTALEAYEKTMRPYVAKAQDIPSWAPGLLNPQTQLGVNVVNAAAYTASALKVQSVVQALWGTQGEDQSVPEYEFTHATT